MHAIAVVPIDCWQIFPCSMPSHTFCQCLFMPFGITRIASMSSRTQPLFLSTFSIVACRSFIWIYSGSWSHSMRANGTDEQQNVHRHCTIQFLAARRSSIYRFGASPLQSNQCRLVLCLWYLNCIVPITAYNVALSMFGLSVSAIYSKIFHSKLMWLGVWERRSERENERECVRERERNRECESRSALHLIPGWIFALWCATEIRIDLWLTEMVMSEAEKALDYIRMKSVCLFLSLITWSLLHERWPIFCCSSTALAFSLHLSLLLSLSSLLCAIAHCDWLSPHVSRV